MQVLARAPSISLTGIRMAFHDDTEIEPDKNPVLRLVRRIIPVSPTYDGQRFFTRAEVGGRVRWVATPMLIVLVMVETTDVLFALDSIPAIFGITQSPFIVFTANIFALMGLRQLYFLLGDLLDRLKYLHYGIAFILALLRVLDVI